MPSFYVLEKRRRPMKILHLADTHIGKKVNGYSMVEDQKYILEKVYEIIEAEKVDRVVVAGDVYDKSIPVVEAVEALNDFLKKLSDMGVKTYIISGNHDSSARLEFGSDLMKNSGIYIAKKFNGKIEVVHDKDEYGDIDFYLLPFIKPVDVKHYYGESYEPEAFNSYDSAMKVVMENTSVDESKRNIILSHQFVVGADVSGSEDSPVMVGGVDQIGKDNYEKFDYVALGHIHRSQKIQENIRYSGTLLKYSFGEANQTKEVLIVDMKEKGNIEYKTIPLVPLHDMKEVTGIYDKLTLNEFYMSDDKGFDREDYLKIVLEDESDIPGALNVLRSIYPNLMELGYKRNNGVSINITDGAIKAEQKSPLELVCEFFKKQYNKDLNQDQIKYINEIVEKWED